MTVRFAARRRARDALAIGHGQRKRLLDEHMLAVRKSLERHRGVLLRRRGERHGVDIGIVKNAIANPDSVRRTAAPNSAARSDWASTDRGERAKLGEVAHQIAAPMATAGNGHQW